MEENFLTNQLVGNHNPDIVNKNPKSHNPKVELNAPFIRDNSIFKTPILLNNNHFANGTLRIKKSGYYKLTEHIVFNPNPDNDFVPTDEQAKGEYPTKGPFVLGFFAAITVETENVFIDLNGFSITQSIEFYLRQRFFNIIELASSPFIPNQGPARFGAKIQSAKNTIIANGTLGLSSHNAIHGNACENILINGVNMINFEVGGISLNGSSNIKITNVNIRDPIGRSLKIGVNGRFSSAIFLTRKLSKLTKKTDFKTQVGGKLVSILEIRDDLVNIINSVVNKNIQSGLRSVPQYTEEEDIFNNPLGIPDCSAMYGILFNKVGIAINEFGCCTPQIKDDIKFSKNIIIDKVKIDGLIMDPRELVGLKNSKGDMQRDFSGNIIILPTKKWYEGFNNFDIYSPFYHPDGFYDKLLLLQVLTSLLSEKDPSFKGNANIDKSVIKYVTRGNVSFHSIVGDNFKTYRNADIMNHVMKGLVAIRLDFTQNITISDTKITNILNISKLGLTNDYLGNYTDGKSSENPNHRGHPKSSNLDYGYTGNAVRGISSIFSTNVSIRNNLVSNLRSTCGSVLGIDIQKGNDKILVKNNLINTLVAQCKGVVPYKGEYNTNPVPIVAGVFIRRNNQEVNITNTQVSNIFGCGTADKVLDQSVEK